jgi:hypothetical protein
MERRNSSPWRTDGPQQTARIIHNPAVREIALMERLLRSFGLALPNIADLLEVDPSLLAKVLELRHHTAPGFGHQFGIGAGSFECGYQTGA